MNTPALALPLLLILARSLAPGGAPPSEVGAQDPSPVQTTDELSVLLSSYAEVHGGREVLDEFSLLRFEAYTSTFEDGEETRDELPVSVELQRTGERRRVRVEYDQPKEDGGHFRIVQISDGGEFTQVWIDGEAKDIPQVVEEGRLHAAMFLSTVDLLYGLDRPDLQLRIEGEKVRDGVEYLTTHAEFHPDRRIYEAYRHYISLTDGLIRRIDAFSVKTYKRLRRMDFSGYEEHDEIRFPTRVVFKNLAHEAYQAWTFEQVEINPKLDPRRFEEL